MSLFLEFHAVPSECGVLIGLLVLIDTTGDLNTILGYELDDRGSRVRFPAEAGNFSLHHNILNGFGAHPASYPMGTSGSFPGSKAAGA
jgi:hypothetical protein